MAKKMPYADERECMECGSPFEPNNVNDDLCYLCLNAMKKAQKRKGKNQKMAEKKRWYKGVDKKVKEESDID